MLCTVAKSCLFGTLMFHPYLNSCWMESHRIWTVNRQSSGCFILIFLWIYQMYWGCEGSWNFMTPNLHFNFQTQNVLNIIAPQPDDGIVPNFVGRWEPMGRPYTNIFKILSMNYRCGSKSTSCQFQTPTFWKVALRQFYGHISATSWWILTRFWE